MSTKVVLMFPYSGYEAGSERGGERGKLFWRLVECCRRTIDRCPIVVLNRDTERRGKAQAFLDDKRSETDVEIYRVWSVDTCQMWLSGWGYVIDKFVEKGVSRIVQLPGDVESVKDEQDFFNSLKEFIAFGDPWDIIIGDFSSGSRFNAKDLIDWYGTYALMANWFPDITQAILKLRLNKPRSEFLNIRVETLSTLLEYRKFAYEQTLNMLIRSWDPDKGNQLLFSVGSDLVGELDKCEMPTRLREQFQGCGKALTPQTLVDVRQAGSNWIIVDADKKYFVQSENQTLNVYEGQGDWRYEIFRHMLGEFRDDSSFREYRVCLDQIERTERMLKLLWREINEPTSQSEKDFIEDYHALDRRSTSIRENARIIIRNLLRVGLP